MVDDCSILISSSLPISNRMRKKQLKKTSYERTNEAFEMAREKRRRKKEVYTHVPCTYENIHPIFTLS